MLKEEYEWLKKKHLANGLDSREAHKRIEKFVDEINMIRDNLELKKKSESEIELKIQSKFEEEFQKLCCD